MVESGPFIEYCCRIYVRLDVVSQFILFWFVVIVLIWMIINKEP